MLAVGLDAVKTAVAYLGDVDRAGAGGRGTEPLLRRLGDLWMLQWTVFESAFVPLAAGDDGLGAGADRTGAGGLPAQRVPRPRAVLRRPPRLGAPAGRPAGRRTARGTAGGRAGRSAPAHLVVDRRGVAVRAAPCSRRGSRARRRTCCGRRTRRRRARARGPTCCAAWVRWPRRPVTRPCWSGPTPCCASIRVPQGRAWLLGADAYLGVAPGVATGRASGARRGGTRGFPVGGADRRAGGRWPRSAELQGFCNAAVHRRS